MYSLVNADNSNLGRFPANSNLVNYSILREFYSPIHFRSFSIKYVVEGTERYTVNGNEYALQQQEYLLANAFCEGKVEIESKNLVSGVCIDVSSVFLSQAVAGHLDPGHTEPGTELDVFFNTAAFFENAYQARHTHLGACLQELGRSLQADPFSARDFTNEFYFTLAENIVADHRSVFRQLNAVRALKHSTRKELFRRLCRAKAYMDDSFTTIRDIASVAVEAAMSEYHFFRLFKSAFGITPHQYLVKKKMEKAEQLLRQRYGPVSWVAVQVGFADVFSFSKAFKKHFGTSPSAVISRIG